MASSEEELASELLKVEKYPRSSTDRTSGHALLPDGMTYRCAATLLADRVGGSPRARAVGFWALGRCISGKNTITLSDGRVFSKRQLYIEALSNDETLGEAYYNLGAGIDAADETVTLTDGRELSESACYVEALRHRPSIADAYFNLGVMEKALTRLADGRELTERELHLEAVRCCPTHAAALGWLANDLVGTETLSLHDGRVLDARALFIEALRYDANDPFSFLKLALLTPPHTADTPRGDVGVVLADGCMYSRTDLFVRALMLDSSYIRCVTGVFLL